VKWLLSDAKKPACQANCDHSHATLCNNCEVLSEIEKELTSITAEEKMDMVTASLESILEWKRHIVRTINQDQSRQDLLNDLQPHQICIVMDWAMKFLPRKVFKFYAHLQVKIFVLYFML
jgi:hypothetical protein